MNFDRGNRGHESELHRTLKRTVRDLLPHLGFHSAVCEHLCCDIVAMSFGGVLAVEVELSPRNVLKNLQRDFAQGCDFALIICPDLQTLGEVARKLARELPSEFRDRTGIADVATMQRVLSKPFPRNESRNNKEGFDEQSIVTSDRP